MHNDFPKIFFFVICLWNTLMHIVLFRKGMAKGQTICGIFNKTLRRHSTSDYIINNGNEPHYIGNIIFPFETSFLSVLVVQIYSFSVPKAGIWCFRCRAMLASVGNKFTEIRKHGYSIWNYDAICSTTEVTSTSGLAAALLSFQSRATSPY